MNISTEESALPWLSDYDVIFQINVPKDACNFFDRLPPFLRQPNITEVLAMRAELETRLACWYGDQNLGGQPPYSRHMRPRQLVAVRDDGFWKRAEIIYIDTLGMAAVQLVDWDQEAWIEKQDIRWLAKEHALIPALGRTINGPQKVSRKRKYEEIMH